MAVTGLATSNSLVIGYGRAPKVSRGCHILHILQEILSSAADGQPA
jgi:hypothetical protein